MSASRNCFVFAICSILSNIMQSLPFMKLSTKAAIPTRNESKDAGFKLFAATGCFIEPGKFFVLRTDIATAIPPGYCGQIASRSPLLTNHGVSVEETVVNPGFRGNIHVNLRNNGPKTVFINLHDCIAQLVVMETGNFEAREVNELPEFCS